jgi:hypothetical protein
VAELSDFALADENDLELWLGEKLSTPRAESILNQSSALVENYLGRHIITRGTLTEYHSFHSADSDLYVRQWPILSVSTVHEDLDREYGSGDLLTVNTDYIVVMPVGKLMRTISSTGGERSWLNGFRAVKVVYKGGYLNRDVVPNAIKDVTLRHAVSVAKDITRKNQDLSEVTDAMGRLVRFGPTILTSGMKADLAHYRRYSGMGVTYELDN